MTVEGYKHFIDAQSMSAFDVNAFLMSQTVTRFDTAADRDAALEQVVTEGMVSYNKDTGELQLYDGSAWQTVTVAIGAAGSDGQVQYNNGGVFAGASGLYFDDVNDRVGIGTTTPGTKLQVSGSDASARVRIERSGTVFELAPSSGKFFIVDDTSNADAIRLTIDSSGRVGINDSTPSYTLDVNGTGRFTDNVEVSSTTPILTLTGSDSSYAEFRAHGTSQGTGAMYVGQSTVYGGGIFYNGDGSPSYATGETADRVSFFRRDNGTNTVVFEYAYNSNNVTFFGTISGNGSGLTSLNASNISSGTFPDRFSASTRYNIGYIDGVTGSNYDKLRVYNSSSYSIGMVSGITYGHLNDWAMTFRMNNDADRGFWWGDTSDSAAQGAMSLTTFGRLTVAQSLSVGQGNSITSPSTSTVYIGGSIDMTGDIDAASGLAYFNSVYLPSNSGIFWSNGDALKYNDSTNQFTFSGDGDTDIVNDGHLIFDSGIVLSNSDANYGSAELDGYTRGSYYGLNLNNGANFMSNGTAMGIYNDTDNDWIIYGNRNSESYMFYNGSTRVTCRSDGVTNAGRIITDGISYNHSNCGGTANSMALRWVSPYIKGSVDNVVCATLGTVSDERFKRDIESWDGGIDILRQLRTVTYTPRDITAWGEVSMEPIEGYEPREPKHGLIAQEVIQVMPTAVDGASTDSGYLSLNEDELIAMLISAVQNIDNRLTALGA